MAGPHVAGVVALLLSARPDLIGQVDAIEEILESSADQLTGPQECGGIPGSEIPNNTYGHGRVDALAMLTADADEDGSSNLDDCRPVDAAIWSAPGAVIDLKLDGGMQTVLSWTAPPAAGAAGPSYDLLRSGSAADFSAATCMIFSESSDQAVDEEPPGDSFYYLVRLRNECGETIGEGNPQAHQRSAPSCP